jgi:tetratricopeptide (TPR) repeat protein
VATSTSKRPAIPIAPSCRRGDGSKIDGWEILSDPFSDGLEDVCACLWMVFRDLQRWMDAAHKRGDLFGERNHEWRARMLRAMQAAPSLAPALRVFLRLRAEPMSVPAAELGVACLRVWKWAESESLGQTAAHYAETAAYLAPENPGCATAAGFACRSCAWWERALVWYERGFRLAVRCKNRREAIRGLVGCGAVYHALDQPQEARDFYDRASRRALRTNKRRMGAVARHYLFALEVEQGRFPAALEEVSEALNLYPIFDRRVPYLAHDFAFLLIRKRYFGSALLILEKVAPAIRKPDESMLIQGAIARAAGATHQRARYQSAVNWVLEMATVYPQYAAGSLFHLAHGARSVGEWDEAAKYAGRAEHLASIRRDSALVQMISDLRAEIVARTQPEQENTIPCPPAMAAIERMFTIRLRRWLAPDRRGAGANANGANAADLERSRL